MSNSLNQDVAQHFVQPDLGPNCLLRLSGYDKNGKTQMNGLLAKLRVFLFL